MNTQYIAARERLIPSAEAIADAVAGPKPPLNNITREIWSNTWNLTFHKTMDTLARQYGLLS